MLILIKIFTILVLLGLLGLVVPKIIFNRYASTRIFQPENVPESKVGIVFGAGLLRDGSPTAVLRDRVKTGVNLYKNGTVTKLLMSGDNRFENYNEPAAMRDYALALGVPDEDIVMDFAGRRTYDTCYRAKYIFGLDEAVLITQKYHLPRAIYTCNKLGVQSFGVAADQSVYRKRAYLYWQFRELFATSTAWADVWILKPLPVLGFPEPILTETDKAHLSEE